MNKSEAQEKIVKALTLTTAALAQGWTGPLKDAAASVGQSALLLAEAFGSAPAPVANRRSAAQKLRREREREREAKAVVS